MSKEKEIEAMFLNTEPNWDDDEVVEEDSELQPEEEEEEQTSDSELNEDEVEEEEPAEDEDDEDEDDEDEPKPKAKEKEENPKEEDQLFELKHLGSTQRVSRDEVIKLAQMGLDYSRIRKEYDALKAFKGREDHLAFLDELAKAYEQPVDEVIEDWRIRKQAEDEGITEDEAKLKYYKEKAKKAEGKKSDEEIAKAKMNRDFQEMQEEYPELNPKDIPTEVWDEYRNSKKSLLAIYSRYERNKLIKENKEREEKYKNAKKNAKRSMGSVKTAGKSKAVTWGSSLNDDL